MDEKEIILLLGRIDERTQKTDRAVNEIFERINNLPCSTHGEQMKSLIAWRDDCNAIKIEAVKGSISLKNGVIILVLTNAFSVITTIITTRIIG